VSTETGHESAAVAERVEKRWAMLSVAIVVLLAGLAAFAGIHQATMPQSRVETANPATLHISGEFVESNLGSAVEPDGSVTVRMIGQQYSFAPQCVLVPTDTPITIRATSADAVHGFLVEGTNINTMLVPGYISEITARFSTPADHAMPCHEFCGLGHQSMWARVKVIAKADFMALIEKSGSEQKRRLDCVEQ
jgi:cytochrome c oxidase subunit 2